MGVFRGPPLGLDFAPWGAKSDARYPCGQGYSAAVQGERLKWFSCLLPWLSKVKTDPFSVRQNIENFPQPLPQHLWAKTELFSFRQNVEFWAVIQLPGAKKEAGT